MSDDPLDVDAAVAELYREPPESFVAGRDALAKALRAAKRRDEAAAVGKLRRPSRVAWAFNAALAGDADLGARLDDAVAAVTDAQEGAGSLREANAALREVVDDLVEAAARTSADAGHGLDRSGLTPGALAVVGDPDALAELQAGRLGDVPSGGGFGFGLELPEGAERPARRQRTTATKAGGPKAKAKAKAGVEAATTADATRAAPKAEERVSARIASARRAVAEAEGEEAAAGEAAEEAEAAAAESQERVEAAEAERADIEVALAEAQARLARVKRDIAEAIRHHRESEKALAKARDRQGKAEAAAEAARTKLAELDS